MKPGYSSGRWSKVGGKFKSIPDSRYRWNGGHVIDHIRRTTGEYYFAGQYQQSPAPLGGGLVKAGWFKRYGAKGSAGSLRTHGAELGHRQQGDRAQRLA
jgi:hypothetical protein